MNARITRRHFVRWIATATFTLLVSISPTAGAAIIYDWSTVGDPGNAPDSTGFGAVNHVYNIGTYDVTLGQYTAFLSAVAASDPYGLYNSNMAAGESGDSIIQSGGIGSFAYSFGGSNPNVPAFAVSWGDAVRFANWMQNGQPTGLGEVAGSTETGAYTLNGATSNTDLMAVTRNTNATIFLPSENEWYKAAYYDPMNETYWTYPTQNNNPPANETGSLTPVDYDAYQPGPFGAVGMGGDVFQWNENDISGFYRGARGGAFDADPSLQSSSFEYDNLPPDEIGGINGFRLASLPVPEPPALALLAVGAVGLLYRSRRRISITGPNSGDAHN